MKILFAQIWTDLGGGFRSSLICILCLYLPAYTFAAGLTPVHTTLPTEKAWNPWPDADDIILPMPCDGSMVFRAVAVPVKGLLYDKKLVMGLNTTDTERSMYERRYEGHISAPFTQRDVPAAWQPALGHTRDADVYYFIAKYEISQWQWQAVMDATCPAKGITIADASPKTHMTWLEAQQFVSKYTEWLLQNAKAALPMFADNDKDIAFVRLPTETEWEFAARGGMRVPEEHRNQEDFYPLRDYTQNITAGQGVQGAGHADMGLGDFAVFHGSGATALQPIGSRKPNPLLLYDMAGNAREMVQSPFQFTIAERQGGDTQRRLHGSVGGYVSKGGSFLSGETSILPGSREEIPLFQEGGAYKARDLGLRPVLSGINTPASATRLQKLAAESVAMLTTHSPAHMDPRGNLLTELDKIVKVADNDALKKTLGQYRAMVADTLTALDRQQEEAALGTLRSALYQAEGLRNTAFRIVRGERDITDETQRLQSIKGANPQERAKAKLESKKQQERAKKLMKSFEAALHSSTNNYKQDVERLSKLPQDVLTRNVQVLHKEYADESYMSKHMQENMQALEKHLQQARTHGIQSLYKEQLWVDIIPAALRTSSIIKGK